MFVCVELQPGKMKMEGSSTSDAPRDLLSFFRRQIFLVYSALFGVCE